MRLLELHILQSHAVFCGNRDDLGRPKTAIFGGEKRARLSSQCLKRAIRLHMNRDAKWQKYFRAIRTKQVVTQLEKRLKQAADPTEAEKLLAQAAAHALAGLDFEKDGQRVTTSMFFSDGQYKAVAEKLRALPKESCEQATKAVSELAALKAKQKLTVTEEKKIKELDAGLDKLLQKLLVDSLDAEKQPAVVADAVDIALFGRMVASHPKLTVEAAAMFSHALSTHRADPEQDFFTAVDDQQPEEDAGADMMGDLEYISATYYRYAALNLDLLFYQENPKANLAHYANPESAKDRKNIVQAFIEATLQALPSGRKTSMASPTSVDFALGIVRREGQPIQLVNAFDAPVRAKDGSGFLRPSVIRLEEYRTKMLKAWGIQLAEGLPACFYPDAPEGLASAKPLTFSEFVGALLAHVH